MKLLIKIALLVLVSCQLSSNPFGSLVWGRPKTLDPEIFIQLEDKKIELKYSQLSKMPEKTRLTVQSDPAYPGHTMTYVAVPMRAVLSKIGDTGSAEMAQYYCRDGFSAPISMPLLMSQDPQASQAFLALEEPSKPWPVLPLRPKEGSAGPFYLIWINPEKSGIGKEQWPYQLVGFQIQKPMKELYPGIFPDQKASQNDVVHRGFRVFTKNCFSCHKLNQEGRSSMGPDLNIPKNPTEYMTEEGLRTLIRNPQNLRKWDSAKMPGFSSADITPEDLDALVSYLKHMASKKTYSR